MNYFFECSKVIYGSYSSSDYEFQHKLISSHLLRFQGPDFHPHAFSFSCELPDEDALKR